MAKVSRNDPCPCGSGKKYKKCCLDAMSTLQPHPMHRVDEELVLEVLKFARQRLGETWAETAEETYVEDIPPQPEEQPFQMQWSIYHHVPPDGNRPLIDLFLEEKGRRLDEQQRRWIRAQKEAWVSLWEVLTVQPELGTVQLRDLLSGEERSVYDRSMSSEVRPLGVFMARVVDYEGTSLLCGAHPMLLTPLQAQAVVDEMREFLGIESGTVPCAALADPENIGELLSMWRDAVEAAMHPTMPTLTNSDGDPIEWTEDTLVFAPADREAVLEQVGALGTVADENGETVVSFVREGSKLSSSFTNTSLGRAVVGDDWLRTESNSARRADSLRHQIEEACGNRVRFKHRQQKQVEQMLHEPRSAAPRENENLLERPEVQEAIKQHKRQHYERWVDEPVPAIGGLTPREAAADPQQRARLQALLKDIEMHENRQDYRQRIDLDFVWKELGLER